MMLLAVGVALGAAVHVVMQAPVTLAEVLIDSGLSLGLYRRLRRVERAHWLESAVLRTAFPVVWVLLVFVFAALVMQSYAPEAVSIGGVLQHLAAS